ncbi:facilitated trehalose transporter Tret1-like [Haematobia irritans]|uniref:facilitated trehalose transporter Tret1-like n=1 Tax=Haematobia irritans TaxID=7368 RepID=UPI003F5061AA
MVVYHSDLTVLRCSNDFNFLFSFSAPFIAGILADKFGRKWILFSSSIFFIVAFTLALIATQVWMVIMVRAVQGFAGGMVMTVLPIYVGEISTDSVRGATGSLLNLFIQMGILYVYIIGPYVSYMVLQWCCFAIPLLFGVSFICMPESPYYLADKNRSEELTKSIQFLRGQSVCGVQNEIQSIQMTVNESKANKGSLTDLFRNPGNRKALIISSGLVVLQQFCGINVVLFNSQSIFEISDSNLDPALATIIVGLVQAMASLITPLIADRFGRKCLLLISAGVMAVSLIALGIFFFMKLEDGDATSILWLPITALVIYSVAFCVGFGALPWAIIGEIFAPNIRSLASSLVASMMFISVFVLTYFYPEMEMFGVYCVFWFYGLFCIVAFFFVLLVVIETKGLAVQEIQDKLNAKKGYVIT